MNEPTGVSLAQQFAAIGQRAMGCTNVGQSQDEQDLLQVFDELLAFIASDLPPLPCRKGCNQCCQQPPLVSQLEWQAMARAMATLPVDTQQHIRSRAQAQRALEGQFARWQEQLLAAQEHKAPVDFHVQCPFLVEGACAVYDSRPLACRGYGQTMTVMPRLNPQRPLFWGCELSHAHLTEEWPKTGATLPVYVPYQLLMNRLNAASGGGFAFISQWLWQTPVAIGE